MNFKIWKDWEQNKFYEMKNRLGNSVKSGLRKDKKGREYEYFINDNIFNMFYTKIRGDSSPPLVGSGNHSDHSFSSETYSPPYLITSGIYIITCPITKEVYIGQSIDIANRLRVYLDILAGGKPKSGRHFELWLVDKAKQPEMNNFIFFNFKLLNKEVLGDCSMAFNGDKDKLEQLKKDKLNKWENEQIELYKKLGWRLLNENSAPKSEDDDDYVPITIE